jgi:REP element-mobilizing transposase RayT
MSGVPFPKRTRLPHEVYANPEYAFHVVFRAFVDTTPFKGEIGEKVWTLALDETTRPSVRIIAECLMPDHLHVVVQPREESVIRWVNGFKSYSTRLSWGEGRRGPLWQPGFFDHLIRDDSELEATIGYVLRNPAEGGLGDLWPWVFEREDRVRV